MKALTLTQPWATLIALGEKRVETRGWAIDKPQRIAIHAAKGLAEPVCNEEGLRHYVALEPFASALGCHGIHDAEQLPRAAVIAEVDVVACLSTNIPFKSVMQLPELRGFTFAEFEKRFGDYSPGRYAWFLKNLVVHDPPIPARGGRKLWEWERGESGY